MVLGGVTLFGVLRSDAPSPEVPWRAFFLVFLGVFAWAALAERFGLVPACVALLVLTSLARPPVRPLTLVLTTVIVTAGAVVIFIGGFRLPLHAIRW
jgi:putative tricarboxylic transport membrane protein